MTTVQSTRRYAEVAEPYGRTVPVALFVYNRQAELSRVLEGLRNNKVSLLYVFCDGPRSVGDVDAVTETRRLVASIDWTDVVVRESNVNLGTGRSVRRGVGEVLRKHRMVVVCEDDIVFAPGTFTYMCEALRRYERSRAVMSVSAWTHGSITPSGQRMPFFAGRFACWGWGTWRRAWYGMQVPARQLMRLCRLMGRDLDRYGEDVRRMGWSEKHLGIWAVRFVLLHYLRRGLALYPPQSLVENIGFGGSATSTKNQCLWYQNVVAERAEIPGVWPEPVEDERAAELWRSAVRTLEDA